MANRKSRQDVSIADGNSAPGKMRDLGVASSPDAPKAAVPAAAATPDPPPESRCDTGPTADFTADLQLDVEVVLGSILDQKGMIAVVGRYIDTDPTGLFHSLGSIPLASSIKVAVDLGIVSSELGALFYLPILPEQADCEAVVIAGMGDVGRFSRDDLRYLMTNVTVAALGIDKDRFATLLIGAGHNGLPIDRVVEGLIEGIRDAQSRSAAKRRTAFHLMIVENDRGRYEEARICLERIHKLHGSIEHVDIRSVKSREDPRKPDDPGTAGTPPPDQQPEGPPPTRITVAAMTDLDAEEDPVIQYSALAESAVISVREERLSSYFVRQLPIRLVGAQAREEQEALGRLLTNYLLPEDFRQLLDSKTSLSLILDSATARFPWEMAAVTVRGRTTFLGLSLTLTRQFRSLLSAAPGLPPPVDNHLRVLVIADPAPPPFHLDGARKEGMAVVEVMALAQQAWGSRLDVKVSVRIGARAGASQDNLLEQLRAEIPGVDSILASVKPCDPLEILALLLTEHYDVIHFAGHGVFEDGGMGKGWIFDPKCTLSANEIFKFHQVPRLVFANACHSSHLDSGKAGEQSTVQQASLAEAFFSQRIQNYIGAGWEVADDQALTFARHFYLQALGLQIKPEGPGGNGARLELHGYAPPATLGESLADARAKLLDLHATGTTWGAYQHYGRVNDKLLPFRNVKPGPDEL
jgi:hypothetical protein